MANPCGLTYGQTLDIIKKSIIGSNYNGRVEIMNGLQKEGFSYAESKEVTDLYFKLYNKLANNFVVKRPVFNAAQRKQNKINTLSVAYLKGDISGYPLSAQDEAELLKIYEQADKANTPTLKEKYKDEADVFVAKHLPNYDNEVFKGAVYALPLTSVSFVFKSVQSNYFKQWERSFIDSFFNGKKFDFTKLGEFSNLSTSAMYNVLGGGIPATSLYQAESHTHYRGRVAEFDLKGTNVEGKWYYKWLNHWAKFSNRFNSSPDTKGIFSNAERHYYQLSKELYRKEGLKENEAQSKALEDMQLDDMHTAEQMTEDNFNELGLPIRNKKGNYTNEFKVAAQEYARRGRKEEIWQKALDLSKNDFWKKNMTIKSELGFGDTGFFGWQARLLAAVRENIKTKTDNKLGDVFSFNAFGFLNGAANFAEDSAERFAPYGAIKLIALQKKKSSVTDNELLSDINKRQREIVGKVIFTSLFVAMARGIESVLCPNKKDAVSSEQIASGRTQIGICGVPALVPYQMQVAYKAYEIVLNKIKNDEDFWNTVLNILPVLVQPNNMGLGGTVEKIESHVTQMTKALGKGNNVEVQEQKQLIMNEIINATGTMASSFLPYPTRLVKEAATAVQTVRGKTQEQQKLPFATDEVGNYLGAWNTLGKVTVATMGNLTGVSEVVLAALGSGKTYAVDWQGRKVAHFRGSDIIGNRIEYNANDDIIATAGLAAPYVSRTETIETPAGQVAEVALDKVIIVKKKDARYMTDEEYFDLSVALGEVRKGFFEKNQEKLINGVKENKKNYKKVIDNAFKNMKEAGLEAVKLNIKGHEAISHYINSRWRTKGKLSRTETEYKE